MAGGYNVDYLLGVLKEADLISEDQARMVRAKAGPAKAKLARVQRDIRGSADVTPAEIVASFDLTTPKGKRLDEDRTMRALAASLGYPYQKIDPLKIDHALVADSLPRRFSKKYVVLPVRRDGRRLTVAVDNPFNIQLVDDLRATTGMEIEFVISSKTDILRTITEIFGFRASVSRASESAGYEYDLGNLEQLVKFSSEEEIEASDRHVVNAVEYLLRYAFDQGASDLHIEPKRSHSLVRMRIDGVLHGVHKMPKNVHPAVVTRIKTMARLDIAEKRRPQDGRIKTDYGEREVELRISTMPVAFGEKVVIRIFDPDMLMQSLDEMGFYPKEFTLFKSLIARPHGIILVTGPTGSGKTTTLYSALRARATPEVNVVTIEDPIEMVFEDFNQTTINPRAGITFASQLRTILRQDPDVIMVGEVRDAETAQYAVQAALTGHLVLSTLHTNDSAASITRLLDLNIEPYLVGSILVGIVAQRLVRRVCLACRVGRALTLDEAEALQMVLPDGGTGEITVHEGTGCHRCRGSGLRGRIGVFEVLPISDEIRRLIAKRADASQIMKAARREGMMTLRECAIQRLLDGQTTFDEVLRVTADTAY